MANEQKTTFKVTVNSAEAEAAFRRLAEEQNAVIRSSGRLKDAHNKGAGGFRENRQAALEFGRVIQDLPYGINGVANNITRLAEVIGLGGGAITAVSLLTTGLVMWAASSRKAKEESEKWDLKSLIGDTNAYADSLNKVVKELSAMSDTQLSKKIGELNKELADNMRYLTYIVKLKEMGGIGQAISWILGGGEDEADKIKKIKDILTAAVPAIEGEKSWVGQMRSKIKELEDLLETATTKASAEKYAIQIEKLQKELNSLGKTTSGPIKEVKESLDEFNKAFLGVFNNEVTDGVRKQAQELSKWIKIVDEASRKFPPYTMRTINPRFIEGVAVPSKVIPDTSLSYKELREHFSVLSDAFESAMGTINHSWKEGWENMFGEANSMFEQWASDFMQTLTNRIFDKLFFLLLNALPGTGILGTISSLLSPARVQNTNPVYNSISTRYIGEVMQSKTQIINLNLGNKTVETVVLNANNTNQRLRYNYASA